MIDLDRIKNLILESDKPVAVVVTAEGCHRDEPPLLTAMESMIATRMQEMAMAHLCYSEDRMIFPRPLTQVVYWFAPGRLDPIVYRTGNEGPRYFDDDLAAVLRVANGEDAATAFLGDDGVALRERNEQQIASEDTNDLPPKTRMARNLFRQLLHTAKRTMEGVPLGVPQEVFVARFDECLACPKLRDDGRCTQCGCMMKMKANLASASCPLGKWGEHSKETNDG